MDAEMRRLEGQIREIATTVRPEPPDRVVLSFQDVVVIPDASGNDPPRPPSVTAKLLVAYTGQGVLNNV
jgi:hypothetical protein